MEILVIDKRVDFLNAKITLSVTQTPQNHNSLANWTGSELL